MTNISIQGVPGSFSHIAAEYFFPSHNLVCNHDFQSTFRCLIDGKSDFAVIPIENSTVGSILENYSWLTHFPVLVVGEVFVKVNFHLASIPSSTITQVKEVYSHAAGLGQIVKFLDLHSNIKAIEYFDTAGAAELVSQKNNATLAAACSRKASDINGLKIIQENIHDNPKNFTRFFLITKKINNSTTPKTISELKKTLTNKIITKNSFYTEDLNFEKTTLQFELPHKAGSLAEFLMVFAKKGLSLTKIESRPIPGTDWEYRFYIDVLSNLGNQNLIESITEGQKLGSQINILGSYLPGNTIES